MPGCQLQRVSLRVARCQRAAVKRGRASAVERAPARRATRVCNRRIDQALGHRREERHHTRSRRELGIDVGGLEEVTREIAEGRWHIYVRRQHRAAQRAEGVDHEIVVGRNVTVEGDLGGIADRHDAERSEVRRINRGQRRACGVCVERPLGVGHHDDAVSVDRQVLLVAADLIGDVGVVEGSHVAVAVGEALIDGGLKGRDERRGVRGQVEYADHRESPQQVAEDVVQKVPAEPGVLFLLLLQRLDDVCQEPVGVVVGDADRDEVVDVGFGSQPREIVVRVLPRLVVCRVDSVSEIERRPGAGAASVRSG